jgi:hypothetical protein
LRFFNDSGEVKAFTAKDAKKAAKFAKEAAKFAK